MSILGSILGLDGLTGAATAITGTVGDVWKAEAANRATVAQSSNDAQAARYQASGAIATADAASDSWLTRITRPAMVWWAMLTVTGLTAVGYFDPMGATNMINIMSKVPEHFWEMIGGGTGVYFAGRSAEKVASVLPSIISAIRARL